jgi:ParB/RepB/Spo0J family partition protein
MTELNILAVQNADVLRALAAPADRRAIPSNKALAVAVGRDDSNLGKTLKGLIAAGLLLPDPLADGLTSDGLLQLEAINRAETASGGVDVMPEGLLALRHDQILPDPDNARQDWTSDDAKDELDALRADIVKNGLLQNLVVRPMAADDLQDATITVVTPAGEQTLPRYRLVAGERRWRAIGEAINDGDWEPEEPILTRLLDRDAKETRFAAIAENLLRRKLNPIEKAKGFEQLAELGFENKLIAERLGYTPEHVQQHRRFLKLDEADQQRMTLPRDDPKHLSVRDARAKLAAKDNAPEPINLTPTVRLAWIEAIHAALTQSTHGNLWNEVVVAPAASEAWELQQLIEVGALRLEGPKTYNPHVGRYTVRRSHEATYLVVADPIPLDGLLGKDRDSILREEQAKANGARTLPWPSTETRYLTTWLADIGELTEEGAVLVEAARVAAEQREQNSRDLAAAAAARDAVWADARRRHLRLLATAQERPEAGEPQELVSIASDIDRPLPWQALASGVIVAANGKTVKDRTNHYQAPSEQELTINQMIVVAANAAGGVVTPTPAGPEAGEQDEAAFISELTVALQRLDPTLSDEDAPDLADQVLEDFLTGNSIAFGDDGFDWSANGALELAEQHAADAQDTAAEDEAA